MVERLRAQGIRDEKVLEAMLLVPRQNFVEPALAYSAYALLGAGTEALLWGGALLLAGAPVYAWMRRPTAR